MRSHFETIFRTSLIFLLSPLFLLASCTHHSPGSGPQGGINTPSSGGSAPSQGTVSGGGGNGVNGHLIEKFAVPDISVLPEYKLYVKPVLDNLKRGKPDVFAAYLFWTVHHKRWYIVPVALDKLSNDQTDLAFGTDQWARQFQNEIFIDGLQYSQKSLKDKAFLLLHEMVMGARLLMKSTPKDQCLALDIDNAEQDCGSDELFKLAKDNHASGSSRTTMDGEDTGSVRSMTVFLITEHQDLSFESVRRTRLQLGFEYPWDQTVSEIGLSDLDDAIRRANIAGRSWKAAAVGTQPESICTLRNLNWSSPNLSFPVILSNANPAPADQTYQVDDDLGDTIISGYYDQTRFSATEDLADYQGVLSPIAQNASQGEIVDWIHVEPTYKKNDSQMSDRIWIYDLYLTRQTESHNPPELIEMDIYQAKYMMSSDPRKPPEVVKLAQPPTKCVLSAASN